MASDSLDIPCPECGEKVGVGLRKNETRRKIETTCPGCGTQFTVGLDKIYTKEIHIAEVVQGGAMNHGQDVYFDIVDKVGETYRLALPHNQIGILIAKLQLFAETALKDRDSGQPTKPGSPVPLEASVLLNPQGIEICGMEDGSGLALRIWMSPGVSIGIDLPLEYIPQLQESISEQLEKTKQSSPLFSH